MNSPVYLMLVTFSIGFSTFTPSMLSEFQKSPYDAIAVPVMSQYDTARIPTIEDLRPQITQLKTLTTKHIWPWISLNRMVGANPDEKNSYAQVPYFLQTKGADLDNATGAQNDFFRLWRVGLQAANALGSPGVVLDPEFYNNFAGYKVPELAKQSGKTPEQVIELLRGVGARMADIAQEELPRAKILAFFTGLGRPGVYTEGTASYYLAPAYVTMGLLERTKQSGYRLTVISGGETGLGYCSSSLEQLQMKIDKRFKAFLPFLDEYAGILVLGGTIAPWLDQAHRTGYFSKGSCGECPARNVEELQPYLEKLFRNYGYAWIWAAGGGGYLPFDPQVTPRFNATLARALNAAGPTGRKATSEPGKYGRRTPAIH